MVTPAENDALTKVGPGTPGGEWLRRYWHPIAISDRWDGLQTLWEYDRKISFDGEAGTVTSFGDSLGNFKGQPTRVRILGEDLVLFRDGKGRLGLIGLRCPHRAASFEYGKIRQDGIECCYHGWLFDVEGNCLAQPCEPPDSNFKNKIKHLAYKVEEMGGMIWAYMGPDPVPILPKLDVVAREDGVRVIENFGLWTSNYFQITENSLDQLHTVILHGYSEGERSDIWGTDAPVCDWERAPYGIRSIQDRKNIGNFRVSCYVFPLINRLAQPWPGGKFRWPRHSAIWRTPVDDENTLIFSAVFTPEIDGKLPELPPGVTYDITQVLHQHRIQDYDALVSQGRIYDRSGVEMLGQSDRGVILFRKMVLEAIEDVRQGRDPIGVLRGAENDKIIDLSEECIDGFIEPMPKIDAA
jgi:5,5'-dehydrodivanillate O-demethylase oxygenase subunit